MEILLADSGLAEGALPTVSETAQAAGSVIRSALAERPAVVALDNLDRADGGTLDVILALLEPAASWPLVWLLACRPPHPSGRRIALGSRIDRLRRGATGGPIVLGPISEAAVAALTHRILKVGEADACRIASLLHRKAGGNPLFVHECLLALAEEEARRGKGEGRLLRRRVSTLALPPRLREVARRRVAGLPEAARAVLGILSVDPSGLPSAVVAACMDAPERAVLRTLQDLVVGRGLVARGDSGYVIPHPEIREAVLTELLPELRASYHGVVAEFLLGRKGVDSDPDRLAQHLRGAGRSREAADHYLESGTRHMDAHAPEEALVRFELSIACVPPRGTFQARRWKAIALEALGEHAEAGEDLRAMVDDFPLPERDFALVELARFQEGRGRPEDAWTTLERVSASPRIPEVGARRWILRLTLGSTLGREDPVREALSVLPNLLESIPRPAALRGWMAIGAARWRTGDLPGAKSAWETALEIADGRREARTSAFLHCNLSLVHSDMGAWDEAASHARLAAERSLLIEAQDAVVQSHLLIAGIETAFLRFDAARAALAVADAWVDRTGSEGARAQCAAAHAELDLASGETAGVLAWTDRGLELARSMPRQRAGFLHTRSLGLLLAGRPGEAVPYALEALAEFRRLGMTGEASFAAAVLDLSRRRSGSGGGPRELAVGPDDPRLPFVAATAAIFAAPGAGRDAREREARTLARTPLERLWVDWVLTGIRTAPGPVRTA
jgi:tetratricopeptide (TPR) repeat protein